MFSLKSSAAVLVLLIGTVSLTFAQTSTGGVAGTVNDPNGSAVPGAMVKLINQATKIETDTVTNDDGYFRFVNLMPAMYALQVEVRGFKGVHSPPFEVGVS